MATNDEDAVDTGTDKGSSQVGRLVEHPGSMSSQLRFEKYLRDMLVTALKKEGVFDVAEGRPHPKEAELVDHPLPVVSSSTTDIRQLQRLYIECTKMFWSRCFNKLDKSWIRIGL